MRLAVVTTSYPAFEGDPTGAFVADDVRAHETKGRSVRVFAPWDARRCDAQVTQLPHCGLFGWPGMVARLRERPWRAAGAAPWLWQVRAALRAMQPDAVEVHWACPNALAVPRGMPLHLVSHGGDVRLLQRLPAAVLERLVRRACTWRFVSAQLREALESRLSHALRERLRSIAYVEPSALGRIHVSADDRQARRAQHPGPLYVVVARLVPSKEVERAIALFGREAREGSLVIVGDGPERPRLERLAAGLNVHFTGICARPDAHQWIAAADELWMSSRTEGASTVVREARVLGTTVRTL